MEQPQILIIPDVHGRKFWKEAINKFPKQEYPNLQIIFLGDYLDPYPFENISQEEAFDNFIEILNLSIIDNRITYLIGNHDWHYFVDLDSCRMDFRKYEEINKCFVNNISSFELVKSIEINNKKYLFTHAGITNGWLNLISDFAKYEIKNWKTNDEYPDKEKDPKYIWLTKLSDINNTHDFNIFNECLKYYNDTFYTCLISMISRERGGMYAYGSFIWADIHEHLNQQPLEDYYQIFAHSLSYPNYQQFDYEINDNWAMLDASQAFIIDQENNIKPIE